MQRFLTIDEKRLVSALAHAGGITLPSGWMDRVKVTPMNDGGMGSLRFHSTSATRVTRQVSDIKFRDADAVDVIASLNVDEAGMPFELDVWKVDFKPLVRIPEHF